MKMQKSFQQGVKIANFIRVSNCAEKRILSNSRVNLILRNAFNEAKPDLVWPGARLSLITYRVEKLGQGRITMDTHQNTGYFEAPNH
jgi:hypothetical protein